MSSIRNTGILVIFPFGKENNLKIKRITHVKWYQLNEIISTILQLISSTPFVVIKRFILVKKYYYIVGTYVICINYEK